MVYLETTNCELSANEERSRFYGNDTSKENTFGIVHIDDGNKENNDESNRKRAAESSAGIVKLTSKKCNVVRRRECSM
jgi:hypothetical protein